MVKACMRPKKKPISIKVMSVCHFKVPANLPLHATPITPNTHTIVRHLTDFKTTFFCGFVQFLWSPYSSQTHIHDFR